jgi:hypothetical protein
MESQKHIVLLFQNHICTQDAFLLYGPGQCLNISTGAKTFVTGTIEQDEPAVSVGLYFVQGFLDQADHFKIEAVQRARTVEYDARHPMLPLNQDF